MALLSMSEWAATVLDGSIIRASRIAKAEYENGKLSIHARRNIHAGEELCYDYRIPLEDRRSHRHRKAYACACQSPRCRGTLLLKAKRRRG
jgi:hypothetical protein